MWELDYKESWAQKNWCFWTVVLEKTLEGPLDCKEIQPVHPKGNQFWIFFGRTNAKAETPILWPPDVKNWLIWKDPDAREDWRQAEKGTTENEMVGWHYRCNGLEFEWAPGVGDKQGSLACWSPWRHKQSDMTERLDWPYSRLLLSMPTLRILVNFMKPPSVGNFGQHGQSVAHNQMFHLNQGWRSMVPSRSNETNQVIGLFFSMRVLSFTLERMS